MTCGELPPVRFDVNCSLLFGELPLLQRPQAARDAGFDAVELWWPFADPVPSDREAQALVRAVRDAGVRLVSLNGTGGSSERGERGLLSVPGREREFADNLAAVLALARELACPAVHLLYGNRVPGAAPEAQDELAAEHLARAAEQAATSGAVVLVEALSGGPDYPLRTGDDVARVLDRVGSPHVRFLCDLYHLATNGEDVAEVVRGHASRTGHVQVADAPGRHQPGTGALDVAGLLRTLVAMGYAGWVGLEYAPLGPSADSFSWLPRPLRGSGDLHHEA
ncbi:MAG: TIM barrel protein [Actinomycetota bacterium]|nr:TIM barrel protein [Actinomycetota bacterium]